MPPLFLIGFMAAGKTSVGKALAQASGRRFVDLDDVIDSYGEPVPELVARDEAEFRRREAAALADVIAVSVDGPIIATGGGAAAYGDNLDRMRAAGLVVALTCDLEEAKRRAQKGPARPLLAHAGELYTRRAPSYRRAHAVLDTTHRSIADVVHDVRWIEHVARGGDETIVALGRRSYAVTVGDDWQLPKYPGLPTKIAVITDRNVAHHQLRLLEAWTNRHGLAHSVHAIEPGEASKSFEVYRRLSEEMITRGLDRESLIIAFGGGVVGDLAGIVAATLYRGVPIWQLPTTLVAMTDAAIGGKTAIDLPAGKNLIGAFHQPRVVSCNLATLGTLPPRERRAGFGELWKYALLDGPALWTAVDACAPWAAGTQAAAPPALRAVIQRSIAYKAAIVGRDEREITGQRALLNLGHTVGHAIEAAGGMLHGEAVGLGLIAACRVSAALGMAPASLEIDVAAAIRRSGLSADLAPHLTDDVLGRIAVDKKRTGASLRFIAVREVGACEPVAIDVTELRRILRGGSAR